LRADRGLDSATSVLLGAGDPPAQFRGERAPIIVGLLANADIERAVQGVAGEQHVELDRSEGFIPLSS